MNISDQFPVVIYSSEYPIDGVIAGARSRDSENIRGPDCLRIRYQGRTS